MTNSEKAHWYGGPIIGDGGQVLPIPRDSRTRCGLSVFMCWKNVYSRRQLRGGGEVALVPWFLAEPGRCRRCSALLRRDTGLLAGGKD